MNQINADSISKVTLAAAVSPPGELTDLATDVAYPATLSRSSEQEPWLLRIGNRAPLPIQPQLIPAPLRQVLTQLMADTSATAAVPATVNAPETLSSSGPTSASTQASAAPAANNPTSVPPATLRAQALPLQVTVTAAQQLQLNPLSALPLAAAQQLQVLQQLAGVNNRRSSWDVKLDSTSLASRLPASEFSQAALPPTVTVRLQTPAQQWQLQWQSSPAAPFQNVSPSTQQALLAVISQQVGADAMQWSQLPRDVQQQLEKLNPTLVQTLRQSNMPLMLNLQSQGAVLQPAAPQAVPLNSSQWSQLMPNPPPAALQQGRVTISEAARAAMAQEQATPQQASRQPTATPDVEPGNQLKATADAAAVRAQLTLPSEAKNLSNHRAPQQPSSPPTVTTADGATAEPATRAAPTAHSIKPSTLMASATTVFQAPLKQTPQPLRDAVAIASLPQTQSATPFPANTLHEQSSAGPIAATQPQSAAVKQTLTDTVLTNQGTLAAETLDKNEALQASVTPSKHIATSPEQGAVSERSSPTRQAPVDQLPESDSPPLDNISNESSALEPQRHVKTTSVVSAALQTAGLVQTTDQTIHMLPSKLELAKHLMQLLTLLSTSNSPSQATATPGAPNNVASPTEIVPRIHADTLALADAPAAQRPLLQQLQHAMVEPQVLSEAQLQQQLNAALLFNPLQPSMATTAAGTLAIAMQLLLGRLGVPVPDTHKSDKTQKLKEAVQLLELGQARETLKQLASHASAYQTAQLETLAQQKPEQNNWYFQLPLPMQGQSQFAELTVEQRQARKANGQMAPLWHLTLALEVPPYGRLVMEGALGPDANSLQFYTASPELKRSIEKFGVILRDRLKLQGVPIAQFQCTLGELPAHLAQKQSSLLQVQV